MAYKKYIQDLRNKSISELKEIDKNIKTELKKERNKKKIKRDYERILILECKKADMKLILSQEKQDKKQKKVLK